MKKHTFTCWVIYLFAIFGLHCSSANEDELVIAVAANAMLAVQEFTATFSANNHIPCKLISGSTGKLTTQIQNGAPYHFFFSADTAAILRLKEGGLVNGCEGVYAQGRLVLWSNNMPLPLHFADLEDSRFKHIAIGNPALAPYGKAAVQFLKNIGIYDAVEHKLVFGENVAQTAQFVQSGAADIAIIAQSMVVQGPLLKHGLYDVIPDSLHAPIQQGYACLGHSNTQIQQAQLKLSKAIHTSSVQEVFNKHGYE